MKRWRDLGLVVAVGEQASAGMPSLAPISRIGRLSASRAISMSVFGAIPSLPSPGCPRVDKPANP